MPMIYRPEHPEANENGMVDRAIIMGSAPEFALYVISDTISGTWHPGDGKYYDSKSQFRRTTRSVGAVEVGNDAQRDGRKLPELRDIREDVGRAAEMVRQGYRPAILPENE